MHQKLRALLDLGRVSNLPSVVTNVLAAWVLAGGGFGFGDWVGLVGLLAGALLLYVGGTTLNDAVDARFDRENRPERPIPAGVFSVAEVWAIGIAYLVAGCALLVSLTRAAPLWIAALVLAILLYDLVHKRWRGAVFVMGSCRGFLYLVAASAAMADLGLKPLVLVLVWAAALFLYIVGLTFIARGESTGGGIMPLAIGFLCAPVAAGVGVLFFSWGSLAEGICFAALAGWIGFCLWRLKRDDPGRIGRFVGGLLAGIPLIDGLAVSAHRPVLGVLLLLGLPLSMGLQRMVAAT